MKTYDLSFDPLFVKFLDQIYTIFKEDKEIDIDVYNLYLINQEKAFEVEACIKIHVYLSYICNLIDLFVSNMEGNPIPQEVKSGVLHEILKDIITTENHPYLNNLKVSLPISSTYIN